MLWARSTAPDLWGFQGKKSTSAPCLSTLFLGMLVVTLWLSSTFDCAAHDFIFLAVSRRSSLRAPRQVFGHPPRLLWMPAAPLSGRDLPLSRPHAPTSLPALRRPGLMPWSCRVAGFWSRHAPARTGLRRGATVRCNSPAGTSPSAACILLPAGGFESCPGLPCWACSLTLLGWGKRMGRCRIPL